MANVKFGGGIVAMSGSIGGTTFSRNKSGAYARAKSKPINPKTVLQSAVRALMAAVSVAWNTTVSVAQRSSWAVYGKNVPSTNKMGESIFLSGYNRYVQGNMAAQYAGLPAILDGPTTFTLPGEDPSMAVVVSEATQNIAVTFNALLGWANEDDAGMIIQQGLPQDPSIEFFNGPWRNAGVILGDSVAPPVTGDAVTVSFPVVAGQKIFARARIILADGRLSDWFRTSILASA